MSAHRETISYTLAYEHGALIRRGVTHIRGHEVKTFTNLSRAAEISPLTVGLAVIEAARALRTDPDTVRATLMKNLNTDDVISYTVDPRRNRLVVSSMPITSNGN